MSCLRRRLACVGYRHRLGVVATLEMERLRLGLDAVDMNQLTGVRLMLMRTAESDCASMLSHTLALTAQ